MTKTVEIFANNLSEEKVITFKEGILGLEDFKQYVLLSPEKDLPFKYLQYTESEAVALIVINPFLYMPAYSFDIDDETILALDAKEPADILVLAVVVIPDDYTKMTANFTAPIIINTSNMLGKQMVLQDAKYQIRTPIFEVYQELISRGAE
ncbi:MAG: flagellar assembly protein FliW [Hyphomonadaceae bacterium]|nr:flagellar assembly protein FliW [Clostridia bacterium]